MKIVCEGDSVIRIAVFWFKYVQRQETIEGQKLGKFSEKPVWRQPMLMLRKK